MIQMMQSFQISTIHVAFIGTWFKASKGTWFKASKGTWFKATKCIQRNMIQSYLMGILESSKGHDSKLPKGMIQSSKGHDSKLPKGHDSKLQGAWFKATKGAWFKASKGTWFKASKETWLKWTWFEALNGHIQVFDWTLLRNIFQKNTVQNFQRRDILQPKSKPTTFELEYFHEFL